MSLQLHSASRSRVLMTFLRNKTLKYLVMSTKVFADPLQRIPRNIYQYLINAPLYLSWSRKRRALSLMLKRRARVSAIIKINSTLFESHISHEWENVMNLFKDYKVWCLGGCGESGITIGVEIQNGNLIAKTILYTRKFMEYCCRHIIIDRNAHSTIK